MQLIIIGAGGFGREVLDVVKAIESSATDTNRIRFRGYIDDGRVVPDRLERIGATHLGGTETLAQFAGCHFVVAVGSGVIRERLTNTASRAGLVPAPALIHPAATFGADVTFGDGTIVCAGVRVTTNVRIGEHVHLNINATVGHDSVLEDFVTISPLSAVSGEVRMGRGSMLGTAASINQGLSVGQCATVGSGAAVVKDVPESLTVAGVPARELGTTPKG